MMRKILILFGATFVILGLSACDGVTDGEEDTPESTETSTDEQGPTKRGRTVEEIDEVMIDSDVVKTTLKNITYQVHDPGKDERYILNFEIENKSNLPLLVESRKELMNEEKIDSYSPLKTKLEARETVIEQLAVIGIEESLAEIEK